VSRRLTTVSVCLAIACGGFVAGCGGDSSSGGGSSGGGSSESTGQTKGAKVIDVKSMDGAKGTVNYCQGKDTAGSATSSSSASRPSRVTATCSRPT
jgi:hypothetical protein